MKELQSTLWSTVVEAVRHCHLSTIDGSTIDTETWKKAFDGLVEAVRDERKHNSTFAPELAFLTEDTGISYELQDVLEEYFDTLEEAGEWGAVADSCDRLLGLFVWKKTSPSQYYFRKGNALLKAGRLNDAELFGQQWLSDYPNDLYAAASNAFLLVALGRDDDALALTRKYLGEEFACDKGTDSVYMAAVRLLELTRGSWAKARVAKKIAEYEAMID